MKQFKDKKTIQRLLKAAISHLCRVSVGLEGNFEIDGIICIAQGESEENQFVVKIHEKITDDESDAFAIESFQSKDKESENTSKHYQSKQYEKNKIPGKYPINFHTARKAYSSEKIPDSDHGNQLPDIDDDIEFLGISETKQLFGELDNLSDLECTGYDFDDVSFSDVVIKPDPGSIAKSIRSAGPSGVEDESSDEELKIEQLKAGRVRKPHKGSYRDVHGAPVQVLSNEEFKRILKSEKLKRSRDKSPDFINPQKVLKTSDQSILSMQNQQCAQNHIVSVQQQSLVDWNNIPNIASKGISTVVKSSNYLPIVNKQMKGIVKYSNSNQGSAMNPSFDQNLQRQSFTASLSQKPKWQRQLSSKQIGVDSKLSVSSSISKPNETDKACSILLNNSVQNLSQQVELSLIPHSAATQSQPHFIADKVQTNVGNIPNNQKDESLPIANVICLDSCNEATKSEVHKCSNCSETFNSFRLLDQHMYRHHPGTFLCPLCKKVFKQRSTRNRHIVAAHSTEKNFNCFICKMSFTRADTLKKHISISHPEADLPKTAFSYSKGKEIQQIFPKPDIATVVGNLYGESVITPIQVTAANIENTSTHYTTEAICKNVQGGGNITNITPLSTTSHLNDSSFITHITPHFTSKKLHGDTVLMPNVHTEENIEGNPAVNHLNYNVLVQEQSEIISKSGENTNFTSVPQLYQQQPMNTLVVKDNHPVSSSLPQNSNSVETLHKQLSSSNPSEKSLPGSSVSEARTYADDENEKSLNMTQQTGRVKSVMHESTPPITIDGSAASKHVIHQSTNADSEQINAKNANVAVTNTTESISLPHISSCDKITNIRSPVSIISTCDSITSINSPVSIQSIKPLNNAISQKNMSNGSTMLNSQENHYHLELVSSVVEIDHNNDTNCFKTNRSSEVCESSNVISHAANICNIQQVSHNVSVEDHITDEPNTIEISDEDTRQSSNSPAV